MEENKMKSIWQSGSNTTIKPYSDSELNEIVVKSARKSMKRIQMSGIFQLVIIAVIIHLIWVLVFRDNGLGMNLLYLGALLILVVSYLLGKRSDYKMNKYQYDMPVKEWLEYRINELEKTIYKKKKYNMGMMCLAFLLGFGFHVASQIIMKRPFNLFFSGSIFAGLIIYLVIIGYSLKKNYKKTLKVLKELYKQFEESN